MAIHFEHTDTFGGDANYCWVYRETIETDKALSDLAIVRRAKAFAGFTGIRCRVDNFGDMIQITPQGICQTVFVTFD